MLSPLGIRRQRHRARQLANRVRLAQATARSQTASTYTMLRTRIAEPHSLALALVLGMAVGMLAPNRSGMRAGQQLMRDNLAVQQLVRTARSFLVGRLFGALNR